MHGFKLFSGCPDYGTDTVGVHTDSCEVFFRVCLRAGEEKATHNFSQAKVAEVVCPPGGYTTELFQGAGRDRNVSLSTTQPANLAFEGLATVSRIGVVVIFRVARQGVFHACITCEFDCKLIHLVVSISTLCNNTFLT